MMTGALKHNLGQLYGECILYWLMENVPDGRQIDDLELQEGSGLPDFEFQIGLDWLIDHQVLDRNADLLH